MQRRPNGLKALNLPTSLRVGKRAQKLTIAKFKARNKTWVRFGIGKGYSRISIVARCADLGRHTPAYKSFPSITVNGELAPLISLFMCLKSL